MNTQATMNGDYSFQKVFTELDYMAGGIMIIPPKKSKPLKPARDNSYVRVIEGLMITIAGN